MNSEWDMTLKEISELPFIQKSCISIEVNKKELVTAIAIRSGINLRECYQELHALDRSPYFDLKWFVNRNGTESVQISIRDVKRLTR
ncbi:MAG: hypothetical protein OXH00_26175 [Candidatus Poribacteria bacterium]|nr:hypothetical protein [Candidatus Poribacteria bacterium]